MRQQRLPRLTAIIGGIDNDRNHSVQDPRLRGDELKSISNGLRSTLMIEINP